MKKSSLRLITGIIAGVIGITSAQFVTNAQVAVQRPSDVVGTGPNAWHYLILEGENYISDTDGDSTSIGFVKAYADEAITSSLGNPILATNTTASQKGALYALSPSFGLFADRATYSVQFATTGTYYMYMRFSVFDIQSGNGNYLSEDSFFFPPDFNKDPQTDWPIYPALNGNSGGYVEGCCGTSGFLFFPSVGDPTRIQNSSDTNFWEGHTFAWNDLFSSQFLTLDNGLGGSNGVPNVRFKYEVTPDMLGVPQNFTIGYREAGLTIDLFLFSTHSNLLNFYTQTNLDDLLVKKTTVQDPGDKVGTGSNAWSYLVLEGENYYSKANPTGGFTKVYNDGAISNSLGNPILGTDTTASQKGALYALSPSFGLFADRATYSVQFATTGTYYMYMRFSVFDSQGGNGNYLSEDSFFFPPDFNKDPQTDWPIYPALNGNSGGYVEGCCGTSGFLFFPSVGDPTRIQNSSDTNFWEGHTFAWNDLFSSQFLTLDNGLGGSNGVPNVRFKYEVTPAMVGVPQDFTIGYREPGLTIDLFLFSTHSNLLNFYTQTNLDDILVNKYKLTVQDPGNVAGTGTNTFSYLILEGEDFGAKTANAGTGFAKVYADEAITSSLGNPVLATNTTASQKGALYALSPSFGLFADRVTYQVQFATTGTYYMYMRFSVFDSQGGNGNYLSEDSFFFPPDFNKDPQTDWPIYPALNGNSGGYVEGCCGTSGFLFFPSVGDPTRIQNSSDTNFWEGHTFAWNDLFSSQFLTLDNGLGGSNGVPNVRFKYEVTTNMLGLLQNFTIGYREPGLTIDLFLFSTHSNLLNFYTQAEMDQMLVTQAPSLAITSVSSAGGFVSISWPGEPDVLVQKTTNLANPASWVDIPGSLGNSNYTEAITSTPTFFRLYKP